MNELKEQVGDSTVIGHAALYAQAIELIEGALQDCGYSDLPMTFDPNEATLMLTWSGASRHDIMLIDEDRVFKMGEIIEHLLGPINARFAFSEKFYD